MDAGSVDDSLVLNALFSNSPQGLFVFDSEQRVVRYNPPGRGVRDVPAEDILGNRVEDVAPEFESGEIGALIGEVLRTGRPLRNRLVRGRAPAEPERTLALELSLFPLPGAREGAPAVVGVVEDVTERQAAADRLAVLGAVHRAVGSTLDAQTTADELVEALVPAFADAASVDLLDDPPVAGPRQRSGSLPPNTPLRRTAFAPSGTRTVVREKGDSRPFPFPTPYTQVLNDTQARLVRVSADSSWLAADPGRFAPLVDAGVHSMIVAPLVAQDAVLGLLNLYRHRGDPFTEADLEVARQAASAASAHLSHACSYRREHSVASTLQRRLQPGTVPRLSAVETAHVYLPESAGGDWFDVIPLSGARVALVVGDVNGHGIDAAATMGQLRLALHALALRDLETDELLTHLDEVASLLTAPSPTGGSCVATCAIAVYDPVSRQCTAVRAGHPSPVVVDPDGAPVRLDVPEGPALGGGGGRAYSPATVALPAGSLLALYTNGLVATRGGDWANARHHLEHVLASTTLPLRELCDAAVYRLAPSQDDDAVLLLARTHCLPEDRVADWTLPHDPCVVSTARRLVDQQLTAWDLADAAFTTQLVVSELVTNAVRHGKGPIRLRLIHDRDRLLTEVTDANSASPHLRQARESDEGGRGLFIVMQVSSRWGVRHNRRDKTVWSEQRL
ncbi:SpoIIE family protein phosphatase [Streptomyces sp. NPDC052013]|uniref:SpoIIE family protein phosphatase n=1 Tax=Streptomyces sp. NPDC052013 TaxID=3365679 RepID=UPI0037D92B00